LGDAYWKLDNLRESLVYYRRGVAVREKSVPDSRFDSLLAHGLVRIGSVELRLGNDVAASRAMNRGMRVWKHATVLTDPRLGPTALELARWLVGQERCPEALPMLERVARIDHKRKVAQDTIELRSLNARCGATRAGA